MEMLSKYYLLLHLRNLRSSKELIMLIKYCFFSFCAVFNNGIFFFCWQLMSRISLDHPHHTLFIILALANANKDELLTKPDAIRRNKLTKNAPKEISQLDVVTTKTSILLITFNLWILLKNEKAHHVKTYFSIGLISRVLLRSSRREIVLLIIKPPPFVHT